MFDDSIKYISRCIELGRAGLGNVQPNPMVGCVIVQNGVIIGEGGHQYYGGPHAEANAINSVKDKTPPCTDLILSYNIPNVVISNIDCFSEVAGKGVKKLEKAGVNVTLGTLARESLELNKRFFTFYEKKRPYIILKWAQTIDGFIDIKRDDNSKRGATWITNEYSDILVHKWRSEEDAIMVGTNTALNDNPKLNVRHYHGRNPLRIIIDRNLRLPSHLNLFDKSQSTLVFTESDKLSDANIEYVKIDFNANVCKQMLDVLFSKKVQSVIIEGGKVLLESFINGGLWDEARVFIGNKTFEDGKQAPVISGKLVSKEEIAGDTLLFYVH